MFAWLHNYRRIATRFDYYVENYLGLFTLAAFAFCSMLIYKTACSILVALLLFFLLCLLRALTRRQWLASSICVLIFVVSASLTPNDPLITALFSCLAQTLTVIILLRFGLVALATGYSVSELLVSVPLTTDFSIL